MLAEKQKKAAANKAKKKVKPPGKSMIVFDVKVHDENCDFDKLAEDIMDAEDIPKLQVNEAYDTVDIAYGMQKLRMGIIVQDDCEVGVDEYQEKIAEMFKDRIQSIDTVSFQKL